MNDKSLNGWRLVASSILGGAGGITFALALLIRGDGRPAMLIGIALLCAAILMLPGIYEHMLAALRLPIALLQSIYHSTGVASLTEKKKK